jgi:tetratricopeptide (TPR) repeat protein
LRLLLSSLGALLAIGSTAALLFLDESHSTRLQAQAALEDGDTARALNLYTAELRQDSASPYRWADLAEAYAAAGDIPHARQCFERARQLGPHIPQIWVRDANFHWDLGETDAALSSSARVLATVPDYDGVLFTAFDHLAPNPDQVLAQIGSNKRATISWFQHLLDGDSVPPATAAWRYLFSKNYADDATAAAYIDFLLRKQLYDDARQSWVGYVYNRSRDYPDHNLLFNGSYETNPTGSPFDWRIRPLDQIDTIRDQTNPKDGNWSIHITFRGQSNLAYNNVAQKARVHAGPHRLRAWIRTVNLTTNEGLRLRVFDPEDAARLDRKTSSITGTQPWTLIDELVQIPERTQIVTVEICRLPSSKFDNKIAGDAWIDQVSLTPVHQ